VDLRPGHRALVGGRRLADVLQGGRGGADHDDLAADVGRLEVAALHVDEAEVAERLRPALEVDPVRALRRSLGLATGEHLSRGDRERGQPVLAEEEAALDPVRVLLERGERGHGAAVLEDLATAEDLRLAAGVDRRRGQDDSPASGSHGEDQRLVVPRP
jgi:hypothetical protein